MKTPEEVYAHNQALPGSGLRFGMQTTCIARCVSGAHVLKTGFGGAGVGTMWVPTDAQVAADPDFAKLPTEDCHGGFGLAFMATGKCLCCKCR